MHDAGVVERVLTQTGFVHCAVRDLGTAADLGTLQAYFNTNEFTQVGPLGTQNLEKVLGRLTSNPVAVGFLMGGKTQKPREKTRSFCFCSQACMVRCMHRISGSAGGVLQPNVSRGSSSGDAVSAAHFDQPAATHQTDSKLQLLVPRKNIA
jgi:hypothetical protein